MSFKIKESETTELILDWLSHLPEGQFELNPRYGYWHNKLRRFVKHKSKHFRTGSSDIIGIYKGKFVAIEVKERSEYLYIKKHFKRLLSTPPEAESNKKKKHYIEQILYIIERKKLGGLCGFASEISHVKKILGVK